ncbi:MAG: hypothetical protein ACLGJD_22180 [Gammaproteobacteria bacterium]
MGCSTRCTSLSLANTARASATVRSRTSATL